MLFWEAVEGGTGVFEALCTDRFALGRVANKALEICHWTSEGEDDVACAAACYRCLLTYSNQRQQRLLDRHVIELELRSLAQSGLVEMEPDDYEQQFARLFRLTDSDLERDLLTHIYARRLKLPDAAQNRPAQEIAVQCDFFYESEDHKGTCVFVDGPHHDEPGQTAEDERLRQLLKSAGFQVAVFHHSEPPRQFVERNPDLIGLSAVQPP